MKVNITGILKKNSRNVDREAVESELINIFFKKNDVNEYERLFGNFKITHTINDEEETLHKELPLYLNDFELMLITEASSGSKLWTFHTKVYKQYPNSNNFHIAFEYYLDSDALDLDRTMMTSIVFQSYINKMMWNLDSFSFMTLDTYNSYNPEDNGSNQITHLFPFQQQNVKNMSHIETNAHSYQLDLAYLHQIGEKKISVDPFTNQLKDRVECKVSMRGGILADDMGLGKSRTCLSLISSKPILPTVVPKEKQGYIFSKATLIICPSHLTHQWKHEFINVSNPSAKLLFIVSKTHFEKVSYQDIINSDVIIISFQFLMNFNYYGSLRCDYVASQVKDHYGFKHKWNYLMNLNPMKLTSGNNSHNVNLNSIMAPNLEHFYFHRIIIDETHELFTKTNSNFHSAGYKYFRLWLEYIQSDYRWYISGTPFTDEEGVLSALKFLQFTLEHEKIGKIDLDSSFFRKLMDKEHFLSKIFSKIMVRNKKENVVNQIEIPSYKETIHWVNFTEMERSIYDHAALQKKRGPLFLQKLCCHIYLNEQQGVMEQKIELASVKKELIETNESTIKEYTKKLEKVEDNETNKGRITRYRNKIAEASYILTMLRKVTSICEKKEEECIICLDELKKPVLTKCGHIFCNGCLSQFLRIKQSCPICKAIVQPNETFLIEEQQRPDQVEKTHMSVLFEKYGSKLGQLVYTVEEILSKDNDNRVIIFSQWEEMLLMMGETLKQNKIDNVFVRGNVWVRNNSIQKFKKGHDVKVIMLSLENSASGTNLQEASHVVFIEPVNNEREKLKAIEKQAIGRACRLGQKKEVEVIRILTKDTIEEEIYNNVYA